MKRMSSLLRHPVETEQPCKCCAQVAPVNHCVDHAMLENELGVDRTLRQLDMHELFDDTRTSKADQRARLRQDYITQHGKAGCHAARCRVSKQAEEWHARLAEPCQRSRGLCHLHQRK